MRFAMLLALCAAGCDGGGYAFVPDSIDYECSLDCPLALGSTVSTTATAFTDVDETTTFDQPFVSPPGLATIARQGMYGLDIQPLAVGTGQIGATFFDGQVYTQQIHVADVDTTIVTVSGGPPEYDPASPPQFAVYGGGTVRVFAEHRAATGERLLGHGLEAWTAENAVLAQPPRELVSEPELVRDATASTTASQLAISAGATLGRDVPLVLPVEPLGSAATLEVYFHRDVVATSVALDSSYGNYLDVAPLDGAGRYLLGDAPITAATSDAAIVTAELLGAHTVSLTGHHTGTATVTVTVDGIARTVTVFVAR